MRYASANIIRNRISIASLVAVICILYYTDKQNLGVFFGVSALVDNNFIFVVLMVFFCQLWFFLFWKFSLWFVLLTVSEPKDADIIWTSTQVDEDMKKAAGITDQQYINQFPFEACLVMKHHLAETVHKVRKSSLCMWMLASILFEWTDLCLSAVLN